MKYILFCQIYLGNEKRLAVANLFIFINFNNCNYSAASALTSDFTSVFASVAVSSVAFFLPRRVVFFLAALLATL